MRGRGRWWSSDRCGATACRLRRWVVRSTAVLSGGGVARPPLADARQRTGCMAMPVGASFQKIPVVHQCLLKTSSTCSAVQIRHLVLFYWFGRLHFHHPSVTLIGAPRLGLQLKRGACAPYERRPIQEESTRAARAKR